MRRGKRIACFLVGQPGSGKTTLEKRLVLDVAEHRPSVDSVFVYDRIGEWRSFVADAPARSLIVGASSVAEFNVQCARLAEQLGRPGQSVFPRVVVWWRGDDPASYVPALEIAVAQGHVLNVFCEAAEWFPPILSQWPVKEVRGYSMPSLFRLGRAHIKNAVGDECAWHFLADTQYPSDCHKLLRNTAERVMTSRVEGDDTLRWIRGNFGTDGAELAREVANLDDHQWLTLRPRKRGSERKDGSK